MTEPETSPRSQHSELKELENASPMKIFQIEVSNLCNLRCTYCPHPHQSRPAGLMTEKTFKKAIDLVLQCGQQTAYLHNFGEPLLHPLLPHFVQHCRERDVNPSFFTNGVLLDEEMLLSLWTSGLRSISISEHASGEIGRIKQLLHDTNTSIEVGDTFVPKKSHMHDWAGQVS